MTKQIDIKELIPYMEKGWVACDEDGTWTWYSTRPPLCKQAKMWGVNLETINSDIQYLSVAFNIKPAEDWTKSLIKIG